MSMSISSSTSAASAMMFSRTGGARQRPDASQMADDLFSKLDTQNKGYLESSDLASALGSNSSSTSSASAEEVFKSLDSDSDGKLTKTELSDGLKKVQDQLESSFQAMRTKGKGDMPPPPPPGDEEDSGLTAEQMTEIASKTDDSDLASLMQTLASNFDAADANGDGKVTRDEAMAYQEQNQATGGATTASASSTSSASALDENVVKQIMQLVQTYSGQSSSKAQSTLSTVSIAA